MLFLVIGETIAHVFKSRLNRPREKRYTKATFPLHDFQTSFGLIRMTAVVVPFLYVGTLISKNFAALLEEHDIFVPEDDDDDD